MAQAQETGMFGPMPYEVEEQIRQQRRAEAMQMAQMNPNQVGRYLSASVGDRLGDGVAALTGKQDPRMAQAQELQAIQKRVTDSGINPNDFEAFYGKLGEELAKAGKLKEASNVANVVQKWKENQQNLAIKEEQVALSKLRIEAYKTGKVKQMGAYAKEIFEKNDKYTPASLKAYLDSIGPDKPDGDPSVLEIHVPDGYDSKYVTPDNKPVFTNKAGNVKVKNDKGNLVDYNGPVKANQPSVTVGGTTVTNTTTNEAPKPESALNTVTANATADIWKDAMKEHQKTLKVAKDSSAKTAQMMKLVNDGNLITGSFSDFRKEAERLGVLMGLGNVKKLNDSDLYDKFVMGSVLDLMKQLGGSDSNEELRTLRAAAETRQWNPEAIKRALNWIQSRNAEVQRIEGEYNKGIQSGRTDRFNFDPVQGIWRTDKVQPIAGDEGKSTSTSTTTTKVPAGTKATVESKPAPKAEPAQAPKAGEPPSSIVDKYMKQWGVSREETVRRLMEAKAKQGK